MKIINLFGGSGREIPEEFFVTLDSVTKGFVERQIKKAYRKAKVFLLSDDEYLVTTSKGTETKITVEVVGEKILTRIQRTYLDGKVSTQSHQWRTLFEARQDAKDWVDIAKDDDWGD